MLLGIFFLAASVLLLVYNRRENACAGREAERALRQLQEKIAGANEAGGTVPEASQPEKENTQMPAPERKTREGEYLGYLSVPALNLELPVRSEWSYPELRVSPCRYSGSRKEQNLVIVGHNYSRHFGRLTALQKGDRVLFTDLKGEKSAYAVERGLTQKPTAVRETVLSGYALTLITCTPGGGARVAVQCKAVGVREPDTGSMR